MDIVISEETAKSATEQWPVEVRELAYQLWAFVAGRNGAKVAALLAEQGHKVPERSVRYWASSGAWAERASTDLGRIAPDIRQQTIAELIYGGLEASRGLRAVVTGDEVADKVKVTAYTAMLNFAGFSPVGSNAPELPRVTVEDASKDFRAMSDEERREWQRQQVDAARLPAQSGSKRRKR